MLPGRLLWRLMLWVVVGLAAVSAVFLALLVGSARPAGKASGLIAFARWDGIYAIRADGSGERALRHGGAAAGVVRLAWSPDGRTLAFTNRTGGLWAIDPDGTDLVRLVAATKIAAKTLGPLSWSPDGRRIAFTAIDATHNWDIWLVDTGGRQVQRLGKTSLQEFDVDWSPNGTQIAFTSLKGMWSPLRLHVMSTTGTILRTVNPKGRYEIATADWSPDGRLAFTQWPYTRDGSGWQDAEIWITTASGRWQRLTHNAIVDSDPDWSPDGHKIAFIAASDTLNLVWPLKRSAAEIYVMNADGSGLKRLTHNYLGEGSPAWQPVTAS